MIDILSFPSRLVLELTPLCNLACSMCPRHYITEHDGYMSEALWKKLVDEVNAKAPDAVLLPFWRGESPMHPEFVKLLSYALDKGLRIHLSTNAHFLKGDHIPLLERCEFITFSIHTDYGYKLAKRFVENKPADGPTTQISFVDCEESAQKILPELVKSSDLGGFDSIRLYVEHTKDGVFGYSGRETPMERTFCPKLVDTLVVSADGRISRCNHIWTPESECDLNRITLQEAWESKRMQTIRKTYPDNLCGPCDQWTGHTQGEVWKKTAEGIEHQIYG